MKECPKCGNTYSESFLFCPSDGSPLGGDEEKSEQQGSRTPAQIKVRTLMLGFAILVTCSLVAFATIFFYFYWKPKYGNLTLKTTPPGAMIYVDGNLRGVSPITLSEIRSGGHEIKGAKEGYKTVIQQVTVIPYSTDNLHWNLEPIVPQLSNEQLAEVEALRKKLESAQKENIPLPPPDDYNVLYFANSILAIDPANSYAADVKDKLAETYRHSAELAYAREDWLEAEKKYKDLALILPNDTSLEERLTDIAAKLDESVKDRETQVQAWINRADTAMKLGNLVPPEKDNAYEAIRSIQRLDKNNAYILQALSRLKELMQNRGDTKMAAGDWQGARNDFRLMLQYFPEDSYSKARLSTIETKISETTQLEQQRLQRANEEQLTKQKLAALRQAAFNSFRSGQYEKSISEWQEYLKLEPNSDEAYFYIGAGYQNQKQLDTAILNFEKCLSLNPNNVLAHLNLGILYDYHRNNLKQAEEHLAKAKELGGAEKYTPERLQSMIQDLQDRAQASQVLKMLFPVVHKHAFSSCSGSLRFSEEGLEFRTTETDHSFYEAYTGLRSFSIIGDELSIKTRTNKKYNFQFINPGDAERIRAWSARFIHISGQVD
jgi:tetratricopeptide (TPR) repeat protein